METSVERGQWQSRNLTQNIYLSYLDNCEKVIKINARLNPSTAHTCGKSSAYEQNVLSEVHRFNVITATQIKCGISFEAEI